MKPTHIKVIRSNVHNLKDVSVTLPKDSLIVITGPSGSGKSSLAFDTIYIEGQRRYIESLSSYARQFLGQYQPPDVESIEGLSPAIAINQRTTGKNPRSTVGTITEIYDYMRVLYARAGTFYDPKTGEEVVQYTPPQISRIIIKNKEKSKIHLMSSIKAKNLIEFKAQINQFLTLGFTRAFYNKNLMTLEEILEVKNKTYNFDLVIDRLILKAGIGKRLLESIEQALKFGRGTLKALINDELHVFSELNISPTTEEIYPDLEPRLFSFNSAIGACEKCNGIGESKTLDKTTLIFDDSLSLIDGAIPLLKKNSFLLKMVESVFKAEKIIISTPLRDLNSKITKIIFEGTSKEYQYSFESENSHFKFKKAFPGIEQWLNKKYVETGSEKVRKFMEGFMEIKTCTSCQGQRLRAEALSTKIGDKNISVLCSYSIYDLYLFFIQLKLSQEKSLIADKLLKQIINRLSFLNDVGLHYLTLDRAAGSLSGGESQRIRLASQLGSSLTGVLYVLDEPSIGLHQSDNKKLIQTMINLRDIGNTVLVVEHDLETMKAADYIVDMGPEAGIHGGEVVVEGNISTIIKEQKSLTGRYLKSEDSIEIQNDFMPTNKNLLVLHEASENNLKNITVTFPLGRLIAITGVSGSGKSTLVHNILVPALKKKLSTKSNKILYTKSNYKALTGTDYIKTIIELDQSPIGKSPQSNPATYTGIFDIIRDIFSKTPDSKIRGYKPGRFSFNIKGGRCDDCEGNGVKKIEMHFLPDVFITCVECKGSRYNKETLSILFKGLSIAEVLELTIEEALVFFKNQPKILKTLSTLTEVGLGYIKLGQPATTLSGGEAQRLKLSKELAKRTKGHCLYVLDEPTTGLHFNDIKLLLKAIQKLIDSDNTVVIVEHNIDVIKAAHHIIDLGPEGGINGGEIVFTGTPEEIKRCKASLTGKYL
ncbi:MAG: excinuclease ABC subunit UvrA [Bacteriovoracaceae bacterium]|nr:excinuclease ABC subunit UvrA [Bacteriovoracaceae bacterium]